MILPRPLQRGTWLLDGEDRLLHAHLTLTVAGIAGLRRGALGRARALAGPALGERGNLDLGLGAEYRLFEIQLELVAQVGASKYLGAAALSPGEDISEHLPEDVPEGLPRAESARPSAFQTRVAELVVYRALACVGEDLVGLLGLLELVLGLRIVGISVRVILHGEAPVGLLDVGLGRVSRHFEELVVILLGHYPTCNPLQNRAHPSPAGPKSSSSPSSRHATCPRRA